MTDDDKNNKDSEDNEDNEDNNDWVVVTGGATQRWTEHCRGELAALAAEAEPDARKEFFVVQRLLKVKPEGVPWTHPTHKSLLDRWVDIARRCRMNEK